MGANDMGPVGQSIRRKEDSRFLQGSGQYTDDVVMPRQSYGFFLRSPHAHAKIRKIDTAAAKAAPGVVAVYTAKDLSLKGMESGARRLNFLAGDRVMVEMTPYDLTKGRINYRFK